jgi:hypothetical protein
MIAQIKDEIERLHELSQAVQNYHPNLSDHDALDEYDDIYAELDEIYCELLDHLSDLTEQIDGLVPEED